MRVRSIVCVACALVASGAAAQEGINSDAALQPATGTTIVRQAFRFNRFDDPGDGGREASVYEASTTVVHGIYDRWTLIVNAPLRYRDIETPMGDREDFGFGDLTMLVKARVYRDDFGTNSTLRFAALGGVEIPTYDEPFSSESFNPKLGAVGTLAADRHGISADAIWTFDTDSDDDRLQYDLAYTYRLLPASYGEGVPNTLYGVLELNGRYDAGGDHELMIAPGVQYVMPRWTVEATVQVPVFQDVDERLEREIGVGLIFRFHF